MSNRSNGTTPSLDTAAAKYLRRTSELVYCEPLSHTSAEYGWSIEPHRHENMMQIFFLRSGMGQASLDETRRKLKPGDLLLVPPNCVHAFSWQHGSAGYVVFINRMLLGELQRALDLPLHWCRGAASLITPRKSQPDISYALNALQQEQGHMAGSADKLRFHLSAILLLCIDRLVSGVQRAPQKRHRKQRRLEQFGELVDTHFKQQHQVQWYAGQLGLTPAHLNSLCRELRGNNAQAVIHQRLLAEARRQLVYTPASVADIAIDLGFKDPAYFNRFFRRLEGMPPNRFRKQSASNGLLTR